MARKPISRAVSQRFAVLLRDPDVAGQRAQVEFLGRVCGGQPHESLEASLIGDLHDFAEVAVDVSANVVRQPFPGWDAPVVNAWIEAVKKRVPKPLGRQPALGTPLFHVGTVKTQRIKRQPSV